MRLGPLKYEKLNRGPEVGFFHDLVTKGQVDGVIKAAQGKTKSTPYSVGSNNKAFSKFRTSKVMYQNEHLYDVAMNLSQSVANATRFNLFQEKYASENYQVMNYGIGGTINAHFDSLGNRPAGSSSEALKHGGKRIITFMVYMRTIDLGGRTIFPQIGITVKPELGSALYWFNTAPDDSNDSRILHLGCPVLYGNKWIANKWVKLVAQWKSYPCSSEKHFSIIDAKSSQASLI